MYYPKKTVIQLIVKKVKEVDPEAETFLFGSRARGDYNEDSDWDLLILTNRPVTNRDEQNFRNEITDIEIETEQAISTFVFSKSDWETKHSVTPFYKNVTKDYMKI